MYVAVTGRCHNLLGDHVSRREMHALITRTGHRPWPEVTGATGLLIRAENGRQDTAKCNEARAAMVPIITDRQFFEWLRTEDFSLEDFVRNNGRMPRPAAMGPAPSPSTQPQRSYGGVIGEDRREPRNPRINERFGDDVRTHIPGQIDRAEDQRRLDEAVESAAQEGLIPLGVSVRTTQEALADPQREEIMSDVREQMKDNPAHKPYARGRKIRIRQHRKADYT